MEGNFVRPLLMTASLAALTSACASLPTPKRVDTLNAAPVAADLALAIVPTENTAAAIRFAEENDANHMGKAFATAFSFNAPKIAILGLRKEQPLNTLVSLLRANFKTVVKVDSLNEAKAQGADLIAMLDFYQDFPLSLVFSKGVVGVMSIDETLVFLDPAGQELGKVAAGVKGDVGRAQEERAKTGFFEQMRKGNVTPAWEVYTAMQDELMAKFSAALGACEPLRRYIQQRRSGAPAAAAAPAAARKDGQAPSYRLAEDPAKFALVVGIQDYQSLAPADYAERDADAVREHLRALGYPDRNVVLLTGAQAGKSGLEKYLESWLPRNVGANGQVVFYFAGHGAPDLKTGQAYLMPWDADAAFVDTTAYPVKRLYEKLAALKAKSVIVAFDAGFTGAGGRSIVAKGARPLVARSDASMPPSGAMAVLEAASADETAASDPGHEHGLFTYQLLKALNERGGGASLKALFESLKPRVQDAARQENREQTPLLLTAGRPEAVKL